MYMDIVRSNPNPNNDLPYGLFYQRMVNGNPRNDHITLLLHADGVSVTRSTKLKMWLFSAVIVELPPKLRHRRCNMIPISIWVGHSEPKMTVWLSSSVENLCRMKAKGK